MRDQFNFVKRFRILREYSDPSILLQYAESDKREDTSKQRCKEIITA